MIQPKISIIVPIHNAGVYVEKCLNSLASQTLEDIEVILILDCPTDGSDKVAEEYAKRDSRFRLIYNSENLHTGLSRNKGVALAKGKYIGFHDHDDYSEPSMYERLYNKAESEQFNVVRCNFSCIYTKPKELKEEYHYPTPSVDVSNKAWIYENVSNDGISCVIWNHIYRTDFLKEHNIQFLDSRNICSEDSIFFLEVYHHLDRLGTVDDYLYYHVFHTTNTGKVYNYRSIANRISFFERLYSFLSEKGINERQSQSFLLRNMASSLYSGSRQALFTLPLGKAFSEIRQIRGNRLIINHIRNIYKKENRNILLKLKPTIILFFFILKHLPIAKKNSY